MKKVFALSLVLALAVSSASFGAVAKKKTVTQVTTIKVQNPQSEAVAPVAAPEPAKYNFVISPKAGLMGGVGSSFGLGCEFAMPIIPSVDGMGELFFIPGNGWSIIGLGANGIYKFPAVSGMPVNFYAGGGLMYDMINISSWAVSGGSASAFGFQVLGGMDYPIPGAGTAFGQMKFGIASFSFATIPGLPSQSYNASGFSLEGGYRLYI